MEIDYSDEELDALELFDNAPRKEQVKMMRSRKFSRIAAKLRDIFDKVPCAKPLIFKMQFGAMAPEDQDAIIAMAAVIRGLAEIQQYPEVQHSPLVAKIMQAIHDSVHNLQIYDCNEEAILAAFAAPALSAKNAISAKKFRTTDGDLSDALALYKRWVNEPNLYETKAAFARDCVKKEFCQDLDTPKRWLARWSMDLADDHSLRKKLGVSKKDKV